MKSIVEQNTIIGRIRAAFWKTSEDSDLAEYLIELVKRDSSGVLPFDENTTCMGHRIGDLIRLAEAYKKDGKRIEDISAALKKGYELAREEMEQSMKRVVQDQMQAIAEHSYPYRTMRHEIKPIEPKPETKKYRPLFPYETPMGLTLNGQDVIERDGEFYAEE